MPARGSDQYDIAEPGALARGKPVHATSSPGTPAPGAQATRYTPATQSRHPVQPAPPVRRVRPGPPSQPNGRRRWQLRDRQASYGEVFAIGEFRALWLAQILSYVGDQFAQVAIAILVFERTGSAFLTALAYALTYLPPIVGGPLLSGLADLFPRRRIMIGCDLIRAGLVAGMAIPGTPFAVLCVLLSCTVLLGPPFSSARSAMLPDVLPGDKFVLGSAIGNITYQASQILGFVAGAAFVAALNPSRTLALDALSFVFSALIVATRVKHRPAPHRAHPRRPSLWQVTRDGAALIFRSPLLRSLVLFGWLAGFYVLPEGLAAPYAHALHGSTFDIGLLMAAMPAGTVIGAFALSRLVAPAARLRLMGWMAMLSCAPLIVSAAHPPLGPCSRHGCCPASAAPSRSPRRPRSCRACPARAGRGPSAWPSPGCSPPRASAS